MLRGWSKNTANTSKIAGARHIENGKIAISPQPSDHFKQNLAW